MVSSLHNHNANEKTEKESPKSLLHDQRVDFVIVTALAEERDSVLNKLPGYRHLSPSKDDIRSYYQVDLPVTFPDNSSGTYHVIVMCLLGMGRIQAVTAVTDAIHRWHPRYILLIGIAGGMAARKIGVGDVLISDQIVDYELQKVTPKGSDVRWEVQRADPRLLEACNNFRDDNWFELIEIDRPDTGHPKCCTGPIASGDKVIAFGKIMAKFRKMWPKLIGVEMEASGVATAAFQSVDRPGFFMVRGVSDLADENKDSDDVEKWRLYACDVAASFTIALLKSGPVPLSERSIQVKTKKVQLLLEGEFNEFTSNRQQDLVSVLGALLRIDPNNIRILKVEQGSISISVEMPDKAADLLYEMALKHDSRIMNLGILSIIVEGREIIGIPDKTTRILTSKPEKSEIADTQKYNLNIDTVVGLVMGDHNDVTINYLNGKQYVLPIFLAPPHPPYRLIGRDVLLQVLKHQLLEGGDYAISALDGLPGVGKSALALELAYDREILEHFPDGVLWAGLGRNGDVLYHLGMWGASLGISKDILAKKSSIKDRANAIHVTIGMRKMLIIVDDVWDPVAASAFKVGGPNCVHLLTTRLFEVAGNFAGQKTLLVHELNEGDSVRLLEQFVPSLIQTHPHEVHKLINEVGGLPLALIILGKYLQKASHNNQPRRIQTAIEKLKKAEDRLRIPLGQDVLDHHPSLPAKARISLQAIIEISDLALNKQSRRVLRSLSVLPAKPNSFSEEAALQIGSAQIESLDMLSDYSLLETYGPGRYMMHQTIADYGRIKHSDKTTYGRIVNYYGNFLNANKANYKLLETEITNVLAALNVAYPYKMHDAFVSGVNTLYPFLEIKGRVDLAEQYLEKALVIVGSIKDQYEKLRLLNNLGRLAIYRGNYPEAEKVLVQGINFGANLLKENEVISSLFSNLGITYENLGKYGLADESYQKGLDIARKLEIPDLTVSLLANRGALADQMGDKNIANEYYQEALIIAKRIDNRLKIGELYMSLGALAYDMGDFKEAKRYFLDSLEEERAIDYKERIGQILQNLGGLAINTGDLDQAEVYFSEGLEIARKIQHYERVSFLLNNLGALKFNLGNYGEAENLWAEGLLFAKRLDHKESVTYLLSNLGESANKRGDYDLAVNYFNEALEVARKIKNPVLICGVLCSLGEFYLEREDLEKAEDYTQEAIRLSEKGGKEYIATGLFILARIYAGQNKIPEALSLGQKSLSMFEEMGHYKKDEVVQWLIKMNPGEA